MSTHKTTRTKYIRPRDTSSMANIDTSREMLWQGLIQSNSSDSDIQKITDAWRHIPPTDPEQYIARVNFEKNFIIQQNAQSLQERKPDTQPSVQFVMPSDISSIDQLPASGMIWAKSINSAYNKSDLNDNEINPVHSFTNSNPGIEKIKIPIQTNDPFTDFLVQKWLWARDIAKTLEPPTKRSKEYNLPLTLKMIKSQPPSMDIFSQFSQIQLRCIIEVLNTLISHSPDTSPCLSPNLDKWFWFTLVFLDPAIVPSTQATLFEISSILEKRKSIDKESNFDIRGITIVLTILKKWHILEKVEKANFNLNNQSDPVYDPGTSTQTEDIVI